jgi:hypothetical protein
MDEPPNISGNSLQNFWETVLLRPHAVFHHILQQLPVKRSALDKKDSMGGGVGA